jgi:hypothetical protein
MFALMESELLNWGELLDTLSIGKSLPVDKAQTVYKAIKNKFSGTSKKFSIRTHPITKLKRVIRLK